VQLHGCNGTTAKGGSIALTARCTHFSPATAIDMERGATADGHRLLLCGCQTSVNRRRTAIAS
jgi:hypothetical protein